MKYIRTKDGRIITCGEPTDDGYDKGTMEIQNKPQIVLTLSPFEVLKESHSIEKLCDEFVVKVNIHNVVVHDFRSALNITKDYENHELTKDYEIYGAIWTDKGLIYVVKMNEEGELELL